LADLRHGRIPSLDGVRAIAIFMVLLAHGRSSHGFPSLGRMDWITEHGLLGVEVFFALSGFLITVLMLREFERTRTLNLGAFYLRRVMRIFPAYVALLLAVKWLEVRGLAHPVPGDWTAALTYTMNFRKKWSWELAHLWSLSIEEQFYLLWPLLMLLTPARFRVALPVMGLVIAIGSRCFLLWTFRSHSYGMIRGWTCCRIDSIAAGCLLAVLAWQPQSRALLDRIVRFPGMGAVMLLSLICCIWVGRKWGLWDLTLAYTHKAVCIAGLLWWLVIREKSIISRLLNFPLIAGIGTLSYSLYIWQELFLRNQYFPDAPPHAYWWTTFPQNIACTFIAAGLSYVLIEYPFLKLKDRLGAKRHGSVNAHVMPKP
jgi:peptidoglycan/LPS O-acetylase OafA/YrhL